MLFFTSPSTLITGAISSNPFRVPCWNPCQLPSFPPSLLILKDFCGWVCVLALRGILVLSTRESQDALLLSCLSVFIHLFIVLSFSFIAHTVTSKLSFPHSPEIADCRLQLSKHLLFLLSLLSHLQIHGLHTNCFLIFSSRLCLSHHPAIQWSAVFTRVSDVSFHTRSLDPYSVFIFSYISVVFEVIR